MSYETFADFEFDSVLADMDPSDKICLNCAHWQTDQRQTIVIKTSYGRQEYDVAPCWHNDIEPDAGHGALVLVGPHSHCQMHMDAFEPCDEYRDDFATPVHTRNGVTAGLDFPGTLAPARMAS